MTELMLLDKINEIKPNYYIGIDPYKEGHNEVVVSYLDDDKTLKQIKQSEFNFENSIKELSKLYSRTIIEGNKKLIL